MQFRDLRRQYEYLKDEIDKEILDVINSASFISGKQVEKLEKQLAEFVGVNHCITCGNGTDALNLALMAWNIGAGDAVFVPDFTFFASGETVAYNGAMPIFVDVCEDTYNINVDSLRKAIEKVIEEGRLVPKVIVAVDLFGQPADHIELRNIANQYGMKILEDGAQGFGGRIDKQMACSFGDIATTSFFPAKQLGCYGDGGAIFTDNDEWAHVIRSLSVHGKGNGKYDNIRIGVNSRLDTIQAAILLTKLEAFKKYEMDKVNFAADYYSKQLEDVVIIPKIRSNYYSSWAQYTIQLPNKKIRDGLQAVLKQNEIPSMVYYLKPMHKQEAFKGGKMLAVDCPSTERLCETVLSLPIHPYITMEEQNKVIMHIKKYLETVQGEKVILD